MARVGEFCFSWRGAAAWCAAALAAWCDARPDPGNARDAMGPTSRKTPIAISEIMYKPAPRADGINAEFVEIYNSNPWFHDIGGYRLVAEEMSYTFPTGAVIAGGGYLCVAASPGGIATVYGVTNALGPYAGHLKRSDTIKLLDEAGAELLIVEYDNKLPWPKGADETGHSLALANPTYGENDPRAWGISSMAGGTPGAMDLFVADALDGVVINEFLAHSDPPLKDYIELYNHANAAKDLSGAWLSNVAQTNKFRIPDGTVIPARGFVCFTDEQLGFRPDKTGDQIFLRNSNTTRVVDAVDFEPQEDTVSMGCVPDGSADFYRLATRTPGTNNGPRRASSIVINELMYDPISKDDDDQFIELFNRTTNAVDLGGWRFTDGVEFTFPPETVMAPGAFLVVARNAARLRAAYTNLNPANCLGDFDGKLSHDGERVALAFPNTTVVAGDDDEDDDDEVRSTTMYVPVCEVTYGTGGRWGLWSSGGGSSLELTDPNADTRLAANWADSDESLKSDWKNVEVTGFLDHGSNYGTSIANAQLGLMDAGECLVDNVEIRSGTNAQNLVLNSTFESGTSNWFLEGNHVRSSIENTGFAGSARSLHVRAGSRMWTGANSCEMKLAKNTMAAGQKATLRFRARWLCGSPEILMRLNGNWLEATGTLPAPANPGTPGRPNSRAVSNAPPAIYAVSHAPAVPAASQPVVVTARINDPDGVTNLTLRYRIDPSTTIRSVAMSDNGTGGDAIAGDGVFSATIPGQSGGKIAAFTIRAADARGASSRFPALRAINEPDRECVVMFGDGNPRGSFGVYHLWMTQATMRRWNSLPDLSNESLDCTMVNGNRVIYNMGAHYAGSAYHQQFNGPNGKPCHYKWTFNDDDKFLGATSFNKLHQPGDSPGDDASLQREQFANTFLRALGVPWLNRRYVAVFVNGKRRGTLMEDTQTPDDNVVSERWPKDDKGSLYKMQQWYEFPAGFKDSAIAQNKAWCTLNDYTTTGGVKKTARFRWNFQARNPSDSGNDFTKVFSLIDAANVPAGPDFVARMKAVADMENWMRVFAANHAAGNRDVFGSQNGHNLYGYAGQKGTKFSLLMWDFNAVIGGHGSWAPGSNLFVTCASDPNLKKIFDAPEFRRMYLRALGELVAGPLDLARSGPLLDAKFAAFATNGLAVESPGLAAGRGIKNWTAAAQRSIAAQIASVDAPNFIVCPDVTFTNDKACISGVAPFAVKTILINGTGWPVSWTSVTGWTAQIPIPGGTNIVTVSGTDLHGRPVAGATGTVSFASGAPGDLVSTRQPQRNAIASSPALPPAGFFQ